MRTLLGLLIGVALAAGLLGGCYLQQGGWLMNHPKYSQPRLLGLTPAQVTQRLGPPSFDPQVSVKHPWNVTEDGPYYLGYFQGGGTCVIRFKDGKVDTVERFWK